MQRDRHDYVEYELGAEDQKMVGTPARGENKINSKNAQDQSYTAGRLGGGLTIPKKALGPSPVNVDAQRTPEVALQKGDFLYNLREEKQKRRIAGGGHGYRRQDNCTSPEDICNDDVWTDTSADDDDQVRKNRRRRPHSHQRDTDINQVGSQLTQKGGGRQDSPPLQDDVRNLQCSEAHRFPRAFLEARLETARESREPYLGATCRWLLSNRSRGSSA